MELKDEWFKHFRIFLKINNLYNEFMECFRKQQYRIIHYNLYGDLRPNYIDVMRKYYLNNSEYEEYGAMIFAFNSFNWVGGKVVPIEFTKKWCTVGFKWGLYCIKYNIEICGNQRFINLIEYWGRKHWIDHNFMTEEENKLYEEVKKQERQQRIVRLNMTAII